MAWSSAATIAREAIPSSTNTWAQRGRLHVQNPAARRKIPIAANHDVAGRQI
jgi:hypothetical protein